MTVDISIFVSTYTWTRSSCKSNTKNKSIFTYLYWLRKIIIKPYLYIRDFEELFTKTFKLPIVARNAYAIMENAGLDDDVLNAAAQREPSTFALAPQGGY